MNRSWDRIFGNEEKEKLVLGNKRGVDLIIISLFNKLLIPSKKEILISYRNLIEEN
jgi:hypothetical protein